MANKALIIIPAYNEASVLTDTIRAVRHELKHSDISASILVVDDGSFDETSAVARAVADYVILHRRNCGLGASIMTGIAFARKEHAPLLVTFDADGQHDPKDIVRVIAKIHEGYDVVIGSRFRDGASHVPFLRRLVLFVSNIVTLCFFGIWTTDSQSGFRGLSRRAIENIDLKSNRMEVSSEFFGEIQRLKLSYTEVPIHVRYTPYSLAKGQKNRHSLSVLLKLTYALFR